MSNFPSIGTDQALVQIVNKDVAPVSVSIVSDGCNQCAASILCKLAKVNQSTFQAIDTNYATTFFVHQDDDLNSSKQHCKIKIHLKSLVNYTLYTDNCHYDQVGTPNDYWTPFFCFVATLFLIIFVRNYNWLFSSAKNKFKVWNDKSRFSITLDENEINEIHIMRYDPTKRLKSLDLFRGLVILSMIFCNFNAGGYNFINHAPWYGIHFADLIFPSFLFIMGTSIGLSFHKKVFLNNSPDSDELFPKIKAIARRTLLLFMFGLIVNSIGQPDLSHLRIPGVLQRLAIAYFVVSVLHMLKLQKQKMLRISNNGFNQQLFADLTPYLREWMCVIAGVAVYVYFTLYMDYKPGCEIGYQGPGGFDSGGKYKNCTGGAARAIDVFIFGENHIYARSTATPVYGNSMSHDPEGLLGNFNAILITFYGLQVAKILIHYSTFRDCYSRFGLWAAFTAFIGTTTWAMNVFPICKNLFSFSFINLCASFCFLFFSVIYYFADIHEVFASDNGLLDVGRNSIALYLGHELLSQVLPFYFNVNVTSHYWLLFRTTLATYLWYLIARWFSNNNIHFIV